MAPGRARIKIAAAERATPFTTEMTPLPMKTPRSRIVCATDFSVSAQHAATVAAVLATRSQAELVLVHALDLGPAVLVAARERRVALRVAEMRLKAEVRRLVDCGLKIETKVIEDGWVSEALLGYLRAAPPDFVVVSSRRKSAIDRWAMGSASDQIAQHAPCPTLVVRDPAPLLAWGRGEAPLKVFAALDFDAGSAAALRWVAQLQAIGPCELTAGHVNWRPDNRDVGEPRPDAPRNPPKEQEALERKLGKLVRDIVGHEAARSVVQATWGTPDPVLMEMAAEAGAGLILAGTHQRHGFGWLWHGSVSRNLVHHAPVSVACVPTDAALVPSAMHIPQFRRVLVTTDFSTVGNAAIPWAAAGVTAGGTVELLHVVSTGSGGADRLERARQKLRKLIPMEAQRIGLRTEVVALEGSDAAAAICEEAERFGADVVCLASHGRTGLAKALLGSVAAAVVAGSFRPVLLVRSPK